MSIEEICLIVAFVGIVILAFISGHGIGFSRGIGARRTLVNIVQQMSTESLEELLKNLPSAPSKPNSAVEKLVEKYKKPISKFL